MEKSNGRLPWYDHDGVSCEPYIIGISGGSGSGKTSIAQKIINDLGIPWVTLLSMDSFYKSLTPEQRELAYKNEYDFDHPNSFDYDILYETLVKLKKGIKVDVPMYDFTTHSRLVQTHTLYGANVVIFEGIFSLYDEKVRNLLDLKVFVACDDDIRLARRCKTLRMVYSKVKRDISERGRDLNGVLQQYHQFVKPSYDKYIRSTMDFADIVLPKGIDSQASMDLIIQHVLQQHMKRCFNFRCNLKSMDFEGKDVPKKVHVLDQTPLLTSCLSKFKQENLPRKDFMAVSNNMVVILLQYVASLFEKGGILNDKKEFASRVCGVFVERSNNPIEIDFGLVYPEAPIGKLCIRTDISNGEPGLIRCKLPKDIHSGMVILFDTQCLTGAAAIMAIRVILDHAVPEENIILCSLFCSRPSAILIHSIFPLVMIVACQLEDKLLIDEFKHSD